MTPSVAPKSKGSGVAVWAARLTVTAVIYVASARLGLSLAFRHASVSPLWPPTGVALAALLLLGTRAWPAILVGAFAANRFFTSVPLAADAAIAAGNTLEAIVGALLFRRLIGVEAPFQTVRGVFLYAFPTVPLAAMVSATVGVIALCSTGSASWGEGGPLWWTWWQGDAVGAVIVTPAVLVLTRAWPRWTGKRVVEGLALLATAALVTAEVFGLAFPSGGTFPTAHFVFPVLVWAALRWEQRGVAACLLLVVALAVWGTLRGSGPYLRPTPNESLIFLQLFIASLALTGMALAAVVTERRRAREQVEAQARDLTRSNQELDRFAHVASHDLQEPLRMITTYGQLLERRFATQLDAECGEYLGHVTDAAHRMRRLVTDLLDYSRVDIAPTVAAVDMKRVVRDAMENLAITASELRAEIVPGALPTVRGNYQLLVQVVQNLIGNALKFHGERPPHVDIEAFHEVDRWVFLVRDNGIGFDERYKDRIFTPFERLHPQSEYPGSGIGLSVAKKIIERHGGTMWAEAVQGRGATFYFSLPE